MLVGERPTIERVRAALGTGSPSTLIRHLDAWWKGLGERLAQKQRQVSLRDAPTEVSDAASVMWRCALEKAAEIALSDVAEERRKLQGDRDAIEALREATEKDLAEAELRASDATRAAERSELRAEGLEKVRAQQEARIHSLESELTRAREELERLRSDLQAALLREGEVRRAADDERLSAANHIRSIEDRAHMEVDRVRSELTKSARRILELEKQLHQTQTDSQRRVDTLVRDLRRSEAECSSIKVRLVAAKTAQKGLSNTARKAVRQNETADRILKRVSSKRASVRD